MQLIYIAAPYTAKTHIQTSANISDAKVLAQYYWLQGYAVICPHLNTAFFSGLIPESEFYHGTLKMLAVCDKAVFHPRFGGSHGCCKEFIFAQDKNIPAIQLTIDEFENIKMEVERHIRRLDLK